MLPLPAPELQARSRQLTDIIIDKIEDNDGWIGFDQFMDLALNFPRLGYYSGNLQKFGRDGDFITAPLMGDLFARCIARQCAQILKIPGCQDIYEFGAGSGVLAGDVLLALESLDQLPQHYYILETSPDLGQRQRQHFSQFPENIRSRVRWLESIPDALNGIVLANELLDALPCKRFEIGENGRIIDLGVSVHEGQFCWSHVALIEPSDFDISTTKLAKGYQSEIPLQARAWMHTIGRALNQGVVLLIDYGFPSAEFYHPDRDQGTLMCHYRHHAHPDPFFWPGLQDVTTHIDFSAIAKSAIEAELNVSGYCNQANFLIACGLMDIVTEISSGDLQDSKKMLVLSTQVKKLTMPHEMGELYKVIALSKNLSEPLSGFSIRNHAHRLING